MSGCGCHYSDGSQHFQSLSLYTVVASMQEQMAQHDFMFQGIGIGNPKKDNGGGGATTATGPQHPGHIGSGGMLMMGPPPPLGSLSATGISVAPRGSLVQQQQRSAGQNFVNLQQQLVALQNQRL